MTLIAAADGSALGNPGPAGWGWYIDAHRWASGGWPHGTNNMGELTAVLDLLQQTAGTTEELLVYCDSTYVINSITKWMPGWKRKGWRKGDGKPVQNLDIIKALDEAMQGRRVRFEWVKGHAGHELNEQADRLANAAALAFSRHQQPDPGPGFAGGPTRTDDLAESVESATADRGEQPAPDLFGAFELNELTDEERVVELERSLLTDEVRGDPAAVAALLHPEWTEVGRTGRIWSRDEVLASIGPLTASVSLDVLEIRRLGDLIQLLWRAVGDERSTVRSSLWVRDGGDWRQWFHQATDESDPTA